MGWIAAVGARRSTPASPPGTPFTYGPTEGREAVIAGVGPRTVNDPGGGVTFTSSSTLQTAIDANPSGTKFVCTSSSPTWTAQVKANGKYPRIYFPGAVGSKVIDGGVANFIPLDLGNGGGEVHGGEWRNFGTITTGTPIIHGFLLGPNSIIEDVWIHDVKSAGIGLNDGTGSVVRYSRLNANGSMGLGNSCDNAEIAYCDIYGNNTAGNNPGVEGGAFKMWESTGQWFHHNYVHGNLGFGMWWDTRHTNHLIEENVTEDNQRTGMFIEYCFSGMRVQRNYIANNGRAVVIGGQTASFENCVNARIADCDSANGTFGRSHFTQNYLDHTLAQTSVLGGALLIWHHSNTNIERVQRNWDIHHNQFWVREAQATNPARAIKGFDQATIEADVWDADHRFYTNDYHVSSLNATLWSWDVTGGTGQPKTWSQWQAFSQAGSVAHHDEDSTRSLI